MQAAEHPGSSTPASPTMEAALSGISPTQGKPIARSAAAALRHAPADAGVDTQFSMSMQLDARPTGVLAGAALEVGSFLSLYSMRCCRQLHYLPLNCCGALLVGHALQQCSVIT